MQRTNESVTVDKAPLRPLLLDATDVARLLSVSRSTLYRMIAAGHFPAGFPLNRGSTRWRYETVEAWVDSYCPPAEAGKSRK